MLDYIGRFHFVVSVGFAVGDVVGVTIWFVGSSDLLVI